MFIICYFLCESDMHSGNFGVQDLGKEKVIFKIDMAESLDHGMLKTPLELSALKKNPYIAEKHYQGMSEIRLPQRYVKSDSFQNEKLATIKLIANTPFSFFEDIIRSIITSDFHAHQQTICQKFIASCKDEKTIITLKEMASKIKASEYDVESLIKLLKKRHEKWKLLAFEKNIEQDFSLADAKSFYKQLDLCDDSDSENLEEGFSSSESNLSGLYTGVSFFKESKDIKSKCDDISSRTKNISFLLTSQRSPNIFEGRNEYRKFALLSAYEKAQIMMDNCYSILTKISGLGLSTTELDLHKNSIESTLKQLPNPQVIEELQEMVMDLITED